MEPARLGAAIAGGTRRAVLGWCVDDRGQSAGCREGHRIGFGGTFMRTVFAAALAALLLTSTDSWADVTDAPKRTMPHQEECATPLPADFWDDPAAKSLQRAEAWAWNERICLGQWADMRNAPGGSGGGEECQPAEIKEKRAAVPGHRELRPAFLELILSHEPWASAPRHPRVVLPAPRAALPTRRRTPTRTPEREPSRNRRASGRARRRPPGHSRTAPPGKHSNSRDP